LRVEVADTEPLGEGLTVVCVGFELGLGEELRTPVPDAEIRVLVGAVVGWSRPVTGASRRACGTGEAAGCDGWDSRLGRLGRDPKPPRTPRASAISQAASIATPAATAVRTIRPRARPSAAKIAAFACCPAGSIDRLGPNPDENCPSSW
jgi:hypothetical protein